MDPFDPTTPPTGPDLGKPEGEPTEGPASPPRRRRRRLRVFFVAVVVGIGFGAVAIAKFGQDDAPPKVKAAAGMVVPSTPPTGQAGQGGPVGGVDWMQAMLRGVKQGPMTIGAGPYTIVEFVDFQCPFCAQHELQYQPAAVEELVRTNRARLSILPLAFLGEDSEKARTVYLKLSERDLGWQFADLFFRNQGQENSGYVTREYLEKLLAKIPGTTPADADTTPNAFSEKWTKEIDRFAKIGALTGTPTFAVGRTAAPLGDFTVVGSDFSAALRLLLALEQGGSPTSPGATPAPGVTPAPGGPQGPAETPAPEATPGAPAPDRDLPGGAVTT
ncbi:MAG: thioredoxin domain-containing protein [Solirubrobacteraceae bacterium]|nr:thioredoxin domain-containing protein [Solirubrobacteraceae bacterium]